MQFVKSNSKNKYILTFLVLILSACNLQSNNSFENGEQKVFVAPQCTENSNQAPFTLYPPGGIISATSPYFEWLLPIDCIPIGFRLQIGEYLSAIGEFVFDEEIGSDLFHQLEIELLPNTAYRWRVQALLETGAVNISDFANFVTGPNCTDVSELQAPVLITPANNSITQAKSDGSDELYYEYGYPSGTCLPIGIYVLITDNPEFTGPNYAGLTGWIRPLQSAIPGLFIFSDNQTIGFRTCTTYYWKAWGAMGDPREIWDGGGIKGPESETFSFFTDFVDRDGDHEGDCGKFNLNTEFETSLPAIQITPTVTPTAEIISIVDPIPPATADQDANCRSGPGIIYPSLAFFLKGNTAEILGQNILHDWVLIKLTDSLNCWVWEGALTEDSVFENVDEFPDPPTPTFTPSPTFTPTLTPTPSLTPAPITGAISGIVFRDANSDGNNSGDAGHTGASITLGTGACNSSGFASTSSNGSGGFSFTGLSAGTYCLTIFPPLALSCPRWDVATTSKIFTINLSAGQSVSKIIGFDNSACSVD